MPNLRAQAQEILNWLKASDPTRKPAALYFAQAPAAALDCTMGAEPVELIVAEILCEQASP
jgi:hypothetical protein